MNKWKKQSKANTPATIPTEKTSLMEQGHRIPPQDEGLNIAIVGGGVSGILVTTAHEANLRTTFY
jgi:hypothetical protein